MTERHTYELVLPDFESADESGIASTLTRLTSGLQAPQVRLLSYARAISAERFEQAVRAQGARVQSALGRAYHEEEARTVRAMLSAPAWSFRHYLVTWGQAALGLGAYARPGTPPDALGGRCREHPDYLVPENPALPYVKVVGTYALAPGTWTWRSPWAELLQTAQGAQIVCVDARAIPEYAVRLARQELKHMAQAAEGDDETHVLARVAFDALQAREAFYSLRVLVLLRDADPARLMQRAEAIQQAFEGSLRFSLLKGRQRGALDYFTGAARPRVGELDAHSTVLGSALPVAFGGLAGQVNRPTPRGVYWGLRVGLGRQNLGPVYHDLWRTESGALSNQAAHLGVLGMTGSGKTTFLYGLGARERALNNVDLVLIEPLGNAHKLARLLAGDPGLKHARVTWDGLQVNPLEYIGANEAEQMSHFTGLMQTLLQRALDNLEVRVLTQALRTVWHGRDVARAEHDPDEAPRLEHLCTALDELARTSPHDLERSRAGYLALEIDGLFVSGAYGRTFNRATNLDFALSGATLYDVQGLAGENLHDNPFLTTFYYLALGGLLRTARRRKQAGERRPGVVMIDEWFVLSQNPFLSRIVGQMVKTARNLNLALWLAEQNVATFAGFRDAQAAQMHGAGLTGHHLLSNIPYWVCFRQKSAAEATLFRDAFPERCAPRYAAALPELAEGECVALLERACRVQYVPLPREWQALIGGKA